MKGTCPERAKKKKPEAGSLGLSRKYRVYPWQRISKGFSITDQRRGQGLPLFHFFLVRAPSQSSGSSEGSVIGFFIQSVWKKSKPRTK